MCRGRACQCFSADVVPQGPRLQTEHSHISRGGTDANNMPYLLLIDVGPLAR